MACVPLSLPPTILIQGIADAETPPTQLAKRYHPDSSTEKDAKEKFVEIQEAYDVRPPSLPVPSPTSSSCPTDSKPLDVTGPLGRQEARRL